MVASAKFMIVIIILPTESLDRIKVQVPVFD